MPRHSGLIVSLRGWTLSLHVIDLNQCELEKIWWQTMKRDISIEIDSSKLYLDSLYRHSENAKKRASFCQNGCTVTLLTTYIYFGFLWIVICILRATIYIRTRFNSIQCLRTEAYHLELGDMLLLRAVKYYSGFPKTEEGLYTRKVCHTRDNQIGRFFFYR